MGREDLPSMQARLLHLHARTRQKLARLKQEAERGGAYRVARRFHAVLLNDDGYTSGQIAALLGTPRASPLGWPATSRTAEKVYRRERIQDDRRLWAPSIEAS